MKIINTHSQTVVIDGKNTVLSHYITENAGVFGLGVRLNDECAEDGDLTTSYSLALHIFDIMAKEAVLPLNFYSVLDDMYEIEFEDDQKICEG